MCNTYYKLKRELSYKKFKYESFTIKTTKKLIASKKNYKIFFFNIRIFI
jgi:hypothetical protein